MTYDKIVSDYLNNSNFTRFYHSDAKVPWLWNGSTFVSYDDAESIGLKAEYVNENSLAGAAIWQLGGNVNGTLLNALYNGLQ